MTAAATATTAAATQVTVMPWTKAALAPAARAEPAAPGRVAATPSAPPTDDRTAARAGAGSAATDAGRALVNFEASRLPSTATPRAPPSSRVVSLTADPTPALRSGIDAMIPVVDGAIDRPIPAPIVTMASTRCQYGDATSDWARNSRPRATISRPVLTTLRLPKCSTNRALAGAATIIMKAIGSMRTPASRALYPTTSCRYWVRKKNVPNMAKNTMLMAAVADENVGFRKKRRSSIGNSVRSSHSAKRRSTASPATIGPTVAGAFQPWTGPSMIP